MKSRQIPARLLPSFVVSGKSLNSSFTHCKMRLYHLPYGFPMFVFVKIKDKAKYHAFIDITSQHELICSYYQLGNQLKA